MSMFYVWDLLPILAIAALIISFCIKRNRMKREERGLKEALQSLQNRAEDAAL